MRVLVCVGLMNGMLFCGGACVWVEVFGVGGVVSGLDEGPESGGQWCQVDVV